MIDLSTLPLLKGKKAFVTGMLGNAHRKRDVAYRETSPKASPFRRTSRAQFRPAARSSNGSG
jgi:hypothetical protein